MKKINKIVFVAKDMGGFASLLPVFKKIRNNNKFNFVIILDNPALKFAKQQKIKYIDAANISFSEIKRIIRKINPDIIFTSTSRGISIDKNAVKIAREIKKPAISIVDFWGNYRQRFGENLEYLPDCILAVDEEMKKEMTMDGIPGNRIIVTGNPRFDNLSNNKKSKENKNLIVFYSQPFSELRCKDFNEVEIFKDIVKVLEKICPEKKIIIKFHPAEENCKKFDEIIKNTDLKVKIEKRLEAKQLSKKAELIIGINSMALFDAALMQKKVLSYQPGKSRKKDKLRSNIHGWSLSIYKKKYLSSALKKILSQKGVLKSRLERKEYTGNRSTEKIIDFIGSFVREKKIICVIQARTGSSRLPGKVLFDLMGKPVVLRVVDRVLESKKIDQIIVATTTKKRDDVIVRLVKGYHPKVDFFRGSEKDVLDRYYQATKRYNPDTVMKITADCPLIDPEIIDKVLKEYLKSDVDYASNTFGKRTYPRGLDVDAFSFGLLKELWKEVIWKVDREHVVTFPRRNFTMFKCGRVANKYDYSFHRWTLDEADDYVLIKKIYQKIYPKNPNFKMKEILSLFKKEPGLIKINQHVEQKNPEF